MELRHLRCFLAVAEELYFACAAERQHIKQSLLGSAAVYPQFAQRTLVECRAGDKPAVSSFGVVQRNTVLESSGNEKSAQSWALSGSMMTGKNPMFLAPGLDLRPTEPEGYAGADNHQAGHDDHAELGLGHFTPPPR
ncbi:TPA: hypothetical protein NH348_005442 [Pseudomonas aeruginosa]|nr:hypothetical protein [Pseudomonas aeruginosa]HCF0916102.1 hypothetical protein [Pseudomonas aeruginosa]